MPRHAAFLKFPDGGGAIVHSSKPITACGRCQAKISAYLCDYPTGLGKTCDIPLCDDCRSPQGPDLDYCSAHAEESL